MIEKREYFWHKCNDGNMACWIYRPLPLNIRDEQEDHSDIDWKEITSCLDMPKNKKSDKEQMAHKTIKVHKIKMSLLECHEDKMWVNSITVKIEGFRVYNNYIITPDGLGYTHSNFIEAFYIKTRRCIGDYNNPCYAYFKEGEKLNIDILNKDCFVVGDKIALIVRIYLRKPTTIKWISSDKLVGMKHPQFINDVHKYGLKKMFILRWDAYRKDSLNRCVRLHSDVFPIEYYDEDYPSTNIMPTKNIEKNVYSLIESVADGFEPVTRSYEIISKVNDINGIPIEGYVARQISGPSTTIFSLTKYDCNTLGIKYEKGLQLFPKNMGWIDGDTEIKQEITSETNTIGKFAASDKVCEFDIGLGNDFKVEYDVETNEVYFIHNGVRALDYKLPEVFTLSLISYDYISRNVVLHLKHYNGTYTNMSIPISTILSYENAKH